MRSNSKQPLTRISAGQRLFVLVPRAGLEPARPFEQSILSAPCLPFHHPGEVAAISIPGYRSHPERHDRSVQILVCRCHLVHGVTNVVHAQAVGRARYAGR